MEISIIIVNYNTKELLKQCLNSIYSTLKNDLDFEVIVIDNNSSDDSLFQAKLAFPQVKYIENESNVGYAKAANQGFIVNSGRYRLILSSDTVILEGSIQKMFNFMEKNPDIGILGCKLIMPGNILHENCSAFPWLILVLENPLYIFSLPKWIFRRIKFSFWDYNDIKDVDWLLGACLMIRKEVFDKIGLWDDRFFLYAEDLEFCYRAAKNKTRIIYFPGATVMHCHNVSGRQIFGDKKRLMEYVSMQKFLEKYTGRKGLVFGFATQIVSISVKILLCVLTIVFCPRKRRSVIGYLRLWLFTLLGIAKSGWNAEYQKG